MRIYVLIVIILVSNCKANDKSDATDTSSRVDPKGLKLDLHPSLLNSIERPNEGPADEADALPAGAVTPVAPPNSPVAEPPALVEISLDTVPKVPGAVSPGRTSGISPRPLLNALLVKMHIKRRPPAIENKSGLPS